ncbi:hypothetical protein [Paenibacillus senegalensis]|uniref:hypothetical protein n=1 Tax=Paenibacillus senegalensis TaxID=1465766 RepID=UPI00028927F4|nr:hypothetical protein [Paenibacillus senegalensis]
MNPTPEQQQWIKDYIILEFTSQKLKQDGEALQQLHFPAIYTEAFKHIEERVQKELQHLKERVDEAMTVPMPISENVPGKLTYEYFIQEESHKVRVHEKALQDMAAKVIEQLMN